MLLPAQYADDKGFTLIEVMVAVMIMAIGLLALLQTVNLAIAVNRGNQLRTDAIIFADQTAGSARVTSLANWTDLNRIEQHTNNLGFVNYSVVTITTPIPTSAARDLLVRVAWRDKGVRKTHTLTTNIVEVTN
jgi:prepilin-type N-terminal cleavage/methylation domain-containing protein